MAGTTFAIYAEPYYCAQDCRYMNILTTREPPPGPLRERMYRVQNSRSYVSDTTFYQSNAGGGCCRYGIRDFLCRPGNGNYCEWMSPARLPELTSFLLNSGYQVETQVTNAVRGANVGGTPDALTIMATYTGKAVPNIVYMR